MSSETVKLKRVLTFWNVLFIAIGQIIGAGVITLTGVAIGMTGPAVVFAYLGAAVIILLTSLFFMMGGSAIPATGAFYAWPSRLINGWAGSFSLWLGLIGGLSVALYGLAFGLYLNPLFPLLSVNMWGVVVVTVFFIINLFGLKIASGTQTVFVLILISALAIYAGFGVPQVQMANLQPWFPMGSVGFITAMSLLLFATGGAVLIVSLGGEMKNPKRDIPLVVVISTLGVAVLYAIVSVAAVGVMPWQEMINQPLTVAGRVFLPGWAMLYFIVGGAGLAIITTLNAQFMQYPRNLLAACWDDVLPKWFGRISRYGTPYYILTVLYVIGIVPLLFGLNIDVIAKAATIAAFLPTPILFWALARLPSVLPDRYEKAGFKIGRKWIWPVFALSILSVAIGIYFLSQGLPAIVLIILAIWIVVSAVYYPIRRNVMRKRGIDLDKVTKDLSMFPSV